MKNLFLPYIKKLLLLLLLFCNSNIYAQSSDDGELNRLWSQVEFWEKAGDIDKTIEYKEKLVDLYRNHYPFELPLMLRNMANTYDNLPSPYYQKSRGLFEEALAIISQREKNDSNYSQYYNCVIEMIGGDFSRKDYGSILADINNHFVYLTSSGTSKHKEEINYIKKLKYNTIGLYNDSCKTLYSKDEFNLAYNIMSSYVPEFIQAMRKDSLYANIDNDEFHICLLTVWQYADVVEKQGDVNYSIELRELHNGFLRKHLGYSPNDSAMWKHLWVMERALANKYGETGNRAREIDLSKRIVQEAREYKDSFLLAEKLIDLAVSYDQTLSLEEKRKAQIYNAEALEIFKSLPESPTTTDKILSVIDFLAGEYVLCSQYDDAINLFDKNNSFLEKADIPGNEGKILNVLGWKSSTFSHIDFSIPGSREEAIEINKRLLNFKCRVFGEKSVEYLTQLRLNTIPYVQTDTIRTQLLSRGYELWKTIPQKENIKEYYSFLVTYLNDMYLHGDDSLYAHIEEEIEKTCDSGFLDYHTRLNYYYNRSVKEYNQINYDTALIYINKALNICDIYESRSEINERLAQCLAMKSSISFALDDFATSKESAYRSYVIAEDLNINNLFKANILYTLTFLMDQFGDLPKARSLALEAFDIKYKCLSYSIPLDAINTTLSYLDSSTQLKLLDTLHIENFVLDPEIVSLFVTKAHAHLIQNEKDSVLLCLDQAEKYLLLHEDYYKKNHIYNFAKSQILYNRALIHLKLNDIDKSIAELKEYKRILELDHDMLLLLNTLYALKKDSLNFQKETYKSLDLIRKEITTRFVYLSNHERELYMSNKLSDTIRELESYAFVYPENPYSRKYAFEAVLLEKGLALSSASKVQEYMEKSKVNMDSFQALLKRFRTAKDTKTRHALQLRIDLEEQTIQKSVDMGKIVGELLVNTNDVKKSLPHNSVAVEFIKYPVVNYGIDNEISYRYGALILSNESEFPDFVDLCDEEALVKINKQGSSAYELNAQKAIHKLIWQPLIQYINDIQTIYFSPVDYLCITNLELVAEANYLNKSFVRVSSSRILCNVAQSHLSNKSATLFGGLCYDCSIPRNLSPNLTVNYLASLENDTITRKGISYLPFSKEEVKNISYLSNKYGLQSVLYTDEKGSERDYRDLLNKSIPILHLSTHGFSLGHNTIFDFDEPMRKCGLLLSGAQPAWNGEEVNSEDDGILLGEEIADVKLKDNELVVLSACETGLGKLSAEGVWGLQRAYKKAGAGCVLMSLWKVSDMATTILMNSFYENLFSGCSKHDAIRNAQRFVREYKDENGNRPFESPYYWAAWILLDALN